MLAATVVGNGLTSATRVGVVGEFYLDARAGVLYDKLEGDDHMALPMRPAAYARLGIVLNP